MNASPEGLMVAVVLFALSSRAATEKAPPPVLGQPQDRPDRLIAVSGQRPEELMAEYSADDGNSWTPATIYHGTTIDAWRTCNYATWNRGTIEGRIPAGKQECLWNYFFDLPMPTAQALLRLRTEAGDVVLQQNVNLTGAADVFAIDRRNVVELAGGALPTPWTLGDAGKKNPSVPSITCPVDDPAAPPLVAKPNLVGWHRIYLGMEPFSALQFHLSTEDIRHPIPDYHASPNKHGRDRFLQEFYVKSADLTGQDVCLAIGGARQKWRDLSVRHLRFVPMTAAEIAHHREVRRLAETKGRPCAGYVEQGTAGYYEPGGLDLRAHTRNEMRLNKSRGATEVYVHVIRAGSRAWYHSDLVERCTPAAGEAAPGWVKFAKWMEQGDPMQVAVEEARAAGLRVFPDMGMNVTYLTSDPDYKGLTERTAAEHPEYLVPGHKMFLDYRHEEVRAYVAAIARELMTKYDVDGINLDFARFGHNKAFDEPSLVEVMGRVHAARQEAEAKWRHPITVATRIPSYRYATNADWAKAIYGGEHPWFTAALKTWARNGWIDRVMVCCPIPEHSAELSLERYSAAVANTEVQLWGDLYGGDGRPRSLFLDIARRWVEQGLDGGFFLYTVCRPTEFERINWMLRLIDFPEVRVEP